MEAHHIEEDDKSNVQNLLVSESNDPYHQQNVMNNSIRSNQPQNNSNSQTSVSTPSNNSNNNIPLQQVANYATNNSTNTSIPTNSITSTSNSVNNNNNSNVSTNDQNTFVRVGEEQPYTMSSMFTREQRWSEIQKHVNAIQRYIQTPNIHTLDLSSQNLHELSQNALALYKAIEGLDDKKIPTALPPTPIVSQGQMFVPTPVNVGAPNMYAYRYVYQYPHNPYGELPQLVLEAQSPSSRQRKSSSSGSKRNLSCTSCGVTKTPEWRRGPQGDHTLCNACGLQYAKSLKKQKKEKERTTKESQLISSNIEIVRSSNPGVVSGVVSTSGNPGVNNNNNTGVVPQSNLSEGSNIQASIQ